MDDVYQINVAKTAFREAYCTGDLDLLLSVFHPDGFADMSDGLPSRYGEAARSTLRERAAALFDEYTIKLDVIIIDVVVLGDTAYDFGWHEFTLTPKTAGQTFRKRERYFELWKKTSSGWKVSFFLNNPDVAERLGGLVSHWFKRSEAELLRA